MFSIPTPSVYQSTTCSVTYGTMGHLDPQRLPSKPKPWSSILAQDFVHHVDVILPEEVLHVVKTKILDDPTGGPTYSRVTMTLEQVLRGEFFTEYIKIGNVLMLSEGKVDSDNKFTLKDGVLTMYLDKETYERAGLTGEPYGIKGKRGGRPRWIVRFQLRNPSMLHGKKGFDRLVYSCKHVLNRPITWLFCNLSKTPSPDPLIQHHPIHYTSSPGLMDGLVVNVPLLKPPTSILDKSSRLAFEEFATDIYEWLSLIRLESPRVNVGDHMDPYLSRYAIPGSPQDAHEAGLCKISYRGFLSPTWARQTFADLVEVLPSKSWFSISVTSFSQNVVGDSSDCTILRPPDSPGEYFLWETKKPDRER